MNISEKAKAYAEGKAVSALTSAIEAAYAEGYNAGFADGLASKEGEKPDDLKDDGVEYVDLGLPSGTKWAADYLKDKDGNIVLLPFEKAVKLNIPTMEQVVEQRAHCLIKSTYDYCKAFSIIGSNGEYVCYENSQINEAGRKISFAYPVFWVKTDNQDESRRMAAFIGAENCLAKDLSFGTKAPVILVR